MTEEHKTWIDNASYFELLKRRRFSIDSALILSGESGKYYAKIMQQKKNELTNNEQVRISKLIGWTL